ncbi:IS3 family transposase [Escherichia coli]|nr:transposase [Escherichia coli]EEW3511117.1 transposase [Escherichia coli O156:H25]EFA4267794.1 transposase [Escherichia coli O145:H25]EFN6764761.1 transposase [Escherichia coli O45:H11]ELK8809524.1 transposase [Shigella flexneri]QKB35865.1 transposase [Escherichia coli O55:H7]
MARYCHPPCASLQPVTARTGCSRVPTVLARSSYFYHRAALKAGDKYATIRTMLTDIFNSNYQCYGYRRLHAMLRHEGVRLSEKVVRRLIVE